MDKQRCLALDIQSIFFTSPMTPKDLSALDNNKGNSVVNITISMAEQEPDKQKSYAKFGLQNYQMPQWAMNRKPPNQESISKVKKAMNRSIQELKKDLMIALSNKQQYPDAGKGIDDLLTKAKAGDAKLMEELALIKSAVVPRDVTAKDADMTYNDKQALLKKMYSAENEIFFEKTGSLPSHANLEKIATVAGLYNPGDKTWVQPWNHTKIRELVILDDWPSWLTKAIKLAKGIGEVVAPTLTNAISGFTESIVPSIYPNSVTTQATTINTKSDIMNSKSRMNPNFSPTAVDLDTIASTLTPELYKNVGRFDDAYPSSVSTYYQEIPVTPTTAGGTFFFILNNAQNFSANNGAFITYTTGTSTYVPSTGAYTGATSVINPIVSISSSIESSRILGVSVRINTIVPTSTNYSNGQWDIWHDPSQMDVTGNLTSPTALLTLTNVGYKPFYQRGPITKDYYQVMYNALDNRPFTSTADYDSNSLEAPIVCILTGGNLNAQQVATIGINIVYNNVPTATGLGTQPVRSPNLGPYTADLINSMLTFMPGAFQKNIAERSAAIQKAYMGDHEYTCVMKSFAESFLDSKNANSQLAGHANSPNIGEMSFEKY
jgi:hypothetical protein